MKLMNDLIPADIYIESLAPVDLQRELSLCQLCPKVDCKTKKLDTISKNSRAQFMFIFDQFATHQLDEEHLEKLQVVLGWLQFHPDYAYMTSAMKCEDGLVENCERFLEREVYVLKPQIVFMFTESYSFLNTSVQFGVVQNLFEFPYIELPHPRLWLTEQDYHYVYGMMLHVLQGGR